MAVSGAGPKWRDPPIVVDEGELSVEWSGPAVCDKSLHLQNWIDRFCSPRQKWPGFPAKITSSVCEAA